MLNVEDMLLLALLSFSVVTDIEGVLLIDDDPALDVIRRVDEPAIGECDTLAATFVNELTASIEDERIVVAPVSFSLVGSSEDDIWDTVVPFAGLDVADLVGTL